MWTRTNNRFTFTQFESRLDTAKTRTSPPVPPLLRLLRNESFGQRHVSVPIQVQVPTKTDDHRRSRRVTAADGVCIRRLGVRRRRARQLHRRWLRQRRLCKWDVSVPRRMARTAVPVLRRESQVSITRSTFTHSCSVYLPVYQYAYLHRIRHDYVGQPATDHPISCTVSHDNWFRGFCLYVLNTEEHTKHFYAKSKLVLNRK